MEGKQFSTSRGHSIYVRDFLDRYDPDPLRYYLIAAGPETQDTDFTWAEFVRRNNDELLANWGNLVNRTLTNAHRNFGAVPEPGALTAGGRGAARRRRRRLRRGRRADRGGPLPRRARARRCGSRRPSTSTSATRRRGRSSRPTATRAATVLFVALRAVDSLKTIFTPFLPHTSQVVHELLGYDGLHRRAARVPRGRRGGRTDARGPHRRLPRVGRQLGAERAPARPAAAGAAAALPEARRLGRRRGARADARRRRRVIDTHAHLGDDAAEVLARARAAGVDARRRRRDDVAGRARRRSRSPSAHDGVYACLGVHPHEAGEPGRPRRAARAARASEAVAVGETGLDYFRDYAPHDAQQRLFERAARARARARQAGRDPHPRRRRRHARARSPATTAR